MKIKKFSLERFFLNNESHDTVSLSDAVCDPLQLNELMEYGSSGYLERMGKLSLGYTDSYGSPELRCAISSLYSGVIEADDLITVEPTEGILVALNSLLKAGDHVVMGYPVYEPLYQVAAAIPCEISLWQADPAQWQFDVEKLEGLIRHNTKVIVINFPHNPTGVNLTQSQLIQLVEIARKHDCIVFSDEIFRWSEQNEADRLPAVCEIYEKGVTLSGLSKSFSLPGIRSGWLVTQNRQLIQKFSVFKDYTTGCASAPGELLSLMALAAKDQILNRTLTIVESNLATLDDFFARHQSRFRWVRPRSSLVTLVELIDDDLDDFAKTLLLEKRVLIAPGSVLFLKQMRGGERYFRLGYGRSNLPEALCRLEDFLEHRKPLR